MTKTCRVICVLLIVGAMHGTLLSFNFNGEADDLIFPEMNSLEQIDHVAKVTTNRMLKSIQKVIGYFYLGIASATCNPVFTPVLCNQDNNGFHPPNVRVKAKGQMVGIEDYDPVDPVPSSKASVKHGPIQHGSPLIPYLPNPSPPDYPPSP